MLRSIRSGSRFPATFFALAIAGVLTTTSCGGDGASGLGTAVDSLEGITPVSYEGNFNAEGDRVCTELAALLGWPAMTGMIGVKVDPPVDYANDHVGVTLDDTKKLISWSTTGATMLGFVVKGGNGYNVYDYQGSGYLSDEELQSPPNNGGNVPTVSHYAFCYLPSEPEGEGCTPGYWRNHANRWEGVAASDLFDEVFGVNAFGPGYTLGKAIVAGGGGKFALARHATAALLNAHGGVPNANGKVVEYAYTVEEVIAMVQSAFGPDGDLQAAKNALAAANETGCPLSGTRAVKVQ